MTGVQTCALPIYSEVMFSIRDSRSPENGEFAVVFSHFCDPGLFLNDFDIEFELLGSVQQNGTDVHLFFS